jgi:hypothetical protein
MAAGLGFKDFVTGEVLTAADVDGYLMQGVWVFASAAARDAAVTSPQEGNFAYLKDTNVTTYYTGSAWANLDTTGMTNPMTTTGDTIYSSSGSTPARLGIGTTGQVLTVAGGVPSWATAASGGGITLISDTVASSNSSLSLGSIPGTYKELYLVWSGVYLSDNATRFDIRLNNNSGTDYYGTGFNGDTAVNVFQASGTGVRLGVNGLSFGNNNNSATLQNTAIGSLRVINYQSSTLTKNFFYQNGALDGGAGAGARGGNVYGLYNSTTAITSIDIVRISGSGTFTNASNTSIRLYGVA